MMRECPALVITGVRGQSKNNGNPAFAHLNLCPGLGTFQTVILMFFCVFLQD